MKTISELNEKMWYRALKVVYIFFAGLCYLIATGYLGAGIYWIYENHQDYLVKQERYQSSFKEEEYNELKSENEKAIVMHGIFQNKNKEQIEEALLKYRSDPESIQATSTNSASVVINDVPRKISDLDTYKVIGKNASFQEVPSDPKTFLWSLGMLIFIPICYFLAWLVTKIPRLIFYYVVLGSIKPK